MTAYAEERNIRMTAWRIVVLLCLYSSIAAEVSAQQNSKSIDMRNQLAPIAAEQIEAVQGWSWRLFQTILMHRKGSCRYE